MLSSWDELVTKNDINSLADILAYNQVREHEEMEMENEKLKALISVIIGSKM